MSPRRSTPTPDAARAKGADGPGARRRGRRAHRLRRRHGLQRVGGGRRRSSSTIRSSSSSARPSTPASRSSRIFGLSALRLPPPLQAHVPGARSASAACSSRASSASVTRGGGATRWLSIGPVHVQPAEMAKLALVVLARVLAREEGRQGEDLHRRLLAAPAHGRRLHAALPEAARLRQRRRAPVPDVHDALRGGREGRLHPRRVDPRRRSSARRGDSLQARTATSATSPGSTWTSTGRTSRTSRSSRSCPSARADRGAWASGAGCRHLYLPEAHNDFVAAIVGEELGFVGVLRALGARVLAPRRSAACAPRSARPTTTARTSRSASRRCSACRRS